MNKILLVWNIVITIALVMMVISGCCGTGPAVCQHGHRGTEPPGTA